MLFPSRVGVLSAVVGAAMAASGCSGGSNPDARYLTEAQTEQRSRMLIPDSTLLGVELRKPTDVPPCSSFESEPRPTCSNSEGIELHESEIADFMDRSYLSVTWDVEGNVQSVSALTKPALAETTLSMLVSRFGKPNYQAPEVLPRYRNTWFWTYQDAEVMYMDASGFVMVKMTTAEQSRRDQLESERELAEEVKKSAQKRTL